MPALIAALAVLLLLSSCGEPARPLDVYIAEATADTAARATDGAGRYTATAARLRFSATETAIAHDASANLTQSAVNAAQTLQAMAVVQMTLDRAGGGGTATAQMWPTAAHGTSAAIYAQAEQARIDARNAGMLSDAVTVAGWSLLILAGGALAFAAWAAAATVYERIRHECEMNRLVEDHQAAGNARAWADTEQAPAVPDETLEGIRKQQWRTRIALFLAAGDRHGFSNRILCPDVLSNRAWGPLTDHLAGVGILSKDQQGTRWADGVDLALARERLKSLPLPMGDPPAVKWSGNAHAWEHAETRETSR